PAAVALASGQLLVALRRADDPLGRDGLERLDGRECGRHVALDVEFRPQVVVQRLADDGGGVDVREPVTDEADFRLLFPADLPAVRVRVRLAADAPQESRSG